MANTEQFYFPNDKTFDHCIDQWTKRIDDNPDRLLTLVEILNTNVQNN